MLVNAKWSAAWAHERPPAARGHTRPRKRHRRGPQAPPAATRQGALAFTRHDAPVQAGVQAEGEPPGASPAVAAATAPTGLLVGRASPPVNTVVRALRHRPPV